MMQVLAIFKFAEGKTPADIAPHAAAEAKAVWEQVKAQVVRSAYYRADQPGAVLMLEVPDVESAKKAIESLPAFGAGVIELSDLITLAPYTGFEALFAVA
jgi:hypothetical protein